MFRSHSPDVRLEMARLPTPVAWLLEPRSAADLAPTDRVEVVRWMVGHLMAAPTGAETTLEHYYAQVVAGMDDPPLCEYEAGLTGKTVVIHLLHWATQGDQPELEQALLVTAGGDFVCSVIRRGVDQLADDEMVEGEVESISYRSLDSSELLRLLISQPKLVKGIARAVRTISRTAVALRRQEWEQAQDRTSEIDLVYHRLA